MSRISILGAGGWGLGLALAALRADNKVTVWSPFTEEVEQLRTEREHKKLLAGIKLPQKLQITDNLSDIEGSDITVIATPSVAVRQTAARLKEAACGIIVSVAKGIEYDTAKRLSEVIKDELPSKDVVVLSGPSHAEEVARGIETSLVASSENEMLAKQVQDAFASSKLRVYTNTDVVGVELGGAIKNVIAIAAGFCDGLGLGDNTKAALITRGLSEMARLGKAMGAKRSTFAGLTGMGDLIVTCTSVHSRNHRFGEMVASGSSIKEALDAVGTVEGYYAAKIVKKLSDLYEIEMPISEQCFKVMYENESVKNAVGLLMSRPGRPESDYDWIK